MHQARTPLPLRNDTLLGVCQALGEDFGISPQLLRFAFALAMVWQPVNVVVAYLAIGSVVLLSRLLFPTKRTERAPAAAEPVDLHQEEPELAQAA